jgi:outer membrane protein assembly factor BamB
MKTVRKLQLSCIPSLLLVGLMSVLLTAHPAHASTPASNWSSWGYNAANTRYNPNETILNNGNVGNLVQHWTFTDWNQSTVGSEPAVVNSVVYFGTDDDNFYAVHTKTGTVLWKYTTGGAINSSPTVANGVVYFGSDDDNIYALSAKTGTVLWTYTTGGAVDHSPVIGNGTVYISSGDGNVYALNATTGVPVWRYALLQVMQSSPSLYLVNKKVYLVGQTQVVALSAKTGRVSWSQTVLPGITYSSPAVVNGVVYSWSLAGSGNGTLYAFNAETGALNWSYNSAWFAGSPAIANGTLYCYFNGDINALNATTGAILWGVPAAWDLQTSPAVANGVVYFVNATGSLEATDASSGASLWMSQSLNSVTTGLTIASGQLFAGDADGSLYAFHLPI